MSSERRPFIKRKAELIEMRYNAIEKFREAT